MPTIVCATGGHLRSPVHRHGRMHCACGQKQISRKKLSIDIYQAQPFFQNFKVKLFCMVCVLARAGFRHNLLMLHCLCRDLNRLCVQGQKPTFRTHNFQSSQPPGQAMSRGQDLRPQATNCRKRQSKSIYDTLPARVYISGTSVKKINFGCFNQKKYVLNFSCVFLLLLNLYWG